MLTQESASEPAVIMNYALKKGINILTIDKYCTIGL